MDSLNENLRAIVGREQLLTDPEELLVYECDALTHYKARPRAVVFPRSTEETSEVVRTLSNAGVPFAPRGAGTGLSGGALAVDSGVVIELARMRRLLKLDPSNRLATVETGVVNAQLSRAAAPYNLHYAPDPSSQATCTIGGNIAENAGGIHCLKYGVTVDHVVGARVVLSGGEVVDLQSGEGGAYDLLGVFVGSEGTFGIATEATVRLTPNPPAVRTLLADFASVDEASRAVSAIIAAGLIPAALEMVDGATIRAVESSVFAAGLPLDAEAALLIELDGLEAGLDEEATRAEAICLEHGARRVRRAADEHERKRLWAARKGAFGAMGRITPDLMLQDAVVPRSRLPEVLADTYRIGDKYRLRVANVFHAGDGNLHPYICFDSRKPDEVERVHEAGREIMEACVRAGGTITGEHGIGLDKSAYLPLIFSPDDLDTMLRLRTAFDHSGLCNPGKILPSPRGCGEARAVARKTSGEKGKGGKGEMDKNYASIHHAPASPLSPFTHLPVSPLSSSSRLDSALAGIVGDEHVCETNSAGGRRAWRVAPASAAEACEVLRVASGEGLCVLPAGAGTWLDAGQPECRADVLIETSRMARIVEHEPADLVATVEAGVTLDSLNARLAGSGQSLPLDPPDDGRATVGGVAATGLAGAQSYGYGTPRNFVLGMRVALADGRIVKAGGRVVKNVAGYDLCKLFVGSYGTLGLILELTFKLRPRPAREATICARSALYPSLVGGGRALLAAPFLPVAVELLSPAVARIVGAQDDEKSHALIVRFAGTSQAVEDQLTRAHALLRAQAGIDSLEEFKDDAPLWRNLAATPLHAEAELIWRARVPPSQLDALLAEVEIGSSGHGVGLLWHAGVADGRVRFIGRTKQREAVEQISALEKMRRMARAVGGHLVVERAPLQLKHAFDAWGIEASTARLMRRIKHQLDAHDTFSPNRFFKGEG